MRFKLSAEQEAFAASLNVMLGAAQTPSVARSWAGGDAEPGLALWRRLAEIGVTGLGPVDLVVAFQQLGRHAVPGPLIESFAVLPALAAAFGSDDGQLATVAADVAAGKRVATLAMPPRVPYALDADVADVVLLLVGSTLHRATAGPRLASLDPTRRLFDIAAGQAIGTGDGGPAFDLGVLASAAQLIGAGEAMLERTVRYTLQRSQFGRPIGQFQAVKHQLADAMVGLEFARPLVYGAAIAIADGSTTAGRDVSAARISCADAAGRASRTALQLHGAIGYTAEYDLSIWLTKVRALRSSWGTQADHRARVLAGLSR